jgi:GNAT superfamily N-acetyltransferase
MQAACCILRMPVSLPSTGAAAIRPFHADDLAALYAVSLATGNAGRDAAGLYADPCMVGHIYSAPYGVLAPGLALVAEDAAGVAGFAVGTVDTAGWEALLERRWWPGLRQRYPDPGPEPSPGWSADQGRAFIIHHPSRVPTAIVASYPAHLHLNLLPRLQRRRVGAELLGAWLALARGQGAGCVHVGVNRANTGAIGFWQKQGFRPLDAPPGRTLYFGRDIGPDE